MLNGNHIVEKSKSLVWAKLKDYNAGELKILDTYLSRINARDPDSSCVTFTKKEYAELMGIDADVRTSQLKAYTRSLLGNVVTIDTPNEGYIQYPLFSEAECYYDARANQTIIKIDCHHKLKSVFFDIARDGYIKYQLKNVIALKSQYSIRLYVLLKDRPFGWTVSVKELRERLNATAASYDEFKEFNKHVLQKAIKEINEKTDLHVHAENVKTGRVVAFVKFEVTGIQDINPQTGEILPSEFDGEGERDYIPAHDDPLALYIESLPQEFTREQVAVLRDLAMSHVPDSKESIGAKELWISDYLQSKVLLMRAQKNPVHPNAQFSWLRKAVDEDWK